MRDLIVQQRFTRRTANNRGGIRKALHDVDFSSAALCESASAFGLEAGDFALDADRDAAFAAADTSLEEWDGTAAHQYRGTYVGVQGDTRAGFEPHHVGQAHGLLIKDNVKVDFGIP
jgi:hypothetical protein